MVKSGGQHLPAFIFIGRRHDQHIGDAAQITVIETAGMGGAVRANQTGTVQCKQNIQILDGNIVNQLVVSPLQKVE